MTRADLGKNPADVAAMFDGVAERYDLTNDVLSLGQDRRWRTAVVEAVGPQPGERVLDLCSAPGAKTTHLAALMEARGEIVAVERQEQVAQRVDRWSTREAGTEDGVQALALQGDEGDNLLVGGRARQHGENRGQQQMPHAVALALRATRVRHFSKCRKQNSERHRATSQS